MKILLTNDDGYDAAGLLSMLKALKQDKELHTTYVAPLRHMSVMSHSVTIFKPMEHRIYYDARGNIEGHSIDGTPVDCVGIAVDNILSEKPDLLISGINKGGNFSTISLLSGTYAAAQAGAKLGIPSIAISLLSHMPVKQAVRLGIEGIDESILDGLTDDREFDIAAEFIMFFIKEVMPELEAHAHGVHLFNINIPPIKREFIKGWKFTRFSRHDYSVRYQGLSTSRKENCYWMVTDPMESCLIDMQEGTDDYELCRGYISVTPSTIDFTDHNTLDNLLKGSYKPF